MERKATLNKRAWSQKSYSPMSDRGIPRWFTKQDKTAEMQIINQDLEVKAGGFLQ